MQLITEIVKRLSKRIMKTKVYSIFATPKSLHDKLTDLEIREGNTMWYLNEANQTWHKTIKLFFPSKKMLDKFVILSQEYTPSYPGRIKWMEYISEFQSGELGTPYSSDKKTFYVLEAQCNVLTSNETRNGTIYSDSGVKTKFEHHFWNFVEDSVPELQ